MFKLICCLAGSFVILGLLTSPVYAMSAKIDKGDRYKVELIKKKKKKPQKASKKINMEILKDGYK
jgi:hypothetical protein